MNRNAMYEVCGTRFASVDNAIENAFFKAIDTNNTITIFRTVKNLFGGNVLEKNVVCEITVQDAQTYYDNEKAMRTERDKTRDYELHTNIDAIEKERFYLAMKDTWSDDDFAYDRELRKRLAILKA